MTYPLGKIPIKSNKMENIKKYVRLVDEEYQESYAPIRLWPTTNNYKINIVFCAFSATYI